MAMRVSGRRRSRRAGPPLSRMSRCCAAAPTRVAAGRTPRHASATCPRAPVSGGPRLWTARGAEDACRHAPARAPSRAPGSGGRATTPPPGAPDAPACCGAARPPPAPRRVGRVGERCEPTAPAPAPPGHHGGSGLAAPRARQASMGRLLRRSLAAPAPQACGGRWRQGGRRCPTMPGSTPPSKRQAPGGSHAPAPSAAGGPLWGNGARRASERAGVVNQRACGAAGAWLAAASGFRAATSRRTPRRVARVRSWPRTDARRWPG